MWCPAREPGNLCSLAPVIRVCVEGTFFSDARERWQNLGETFEATLSRAQRLSLQPATGGACQCRWCFYFNSSIKRTRLSLHSSGCVGACALEVSYFFMIHVHRIISLSIKHSTRTLHLPARFSRLLFDFPVGGTGRERGWVMERLSRHSLPIPKAVPAPLDLVRDASLAWLSSFSLWFPG